MKIYTVIKTEVSLEDVERSKLFNVFVIGLPRTGTSLTTKICELLGVKMIYTSEEDKKELDSKYRERFGDYHPNSTGFYEITKSVFEKFLDIASTPYSGCKMIIPVSGVRLDMLRTLPSKVIMTERDPEEIRQSQNAFYSINSDLDYLKTALVQQELDLQKEGISYIKVNYKSLISHPESEILKIKNFIKSDKQIKDAVNFVNPELYRFNRERISIGV